MLSVSSAETSESDQHMTPFIIIAHNVVSTIKLVKMCPFIWQDCGQPASMLYAYNCGQIDRFY